MIYKLAYTHRLGYNRIIKTFLYYDDLINEFNRVNNKVDNIRVYKFKNGKRYKLK